MIVARRIFYGIGFPPGPKYESDQEGVVPSRGACVVM